MINIENIENKIYIPPELAEKADLTAFKKAISLQVNQKLYDKNYITKEMYERAKIAIVSNK